jgi:hypothetical protein
VVARRQRGRLQAEPAAGEACARLLIVRRGMKGSGPSGADIRSKSHSRGIKTHRVLSKRASAIEHAIAKRSHPR